MSAERDGHAVLNALAESLTAEINTVIFTVYQEDDQGVRDTLEKYAEEWKRVRPSDNVSVTFSIQDAVARATSLGGPQKHVLVTGSLYLVGGVLRILES
jgi:folylpolyglutamate synthase/dihydropteroate synthase